MSFNVLEMVKGAVSDQIMGQLGGMLGLPDNKKASSAVEMAAGTVLGGILKKASSPQGAQDLFKAVQGVDTGVLDNLGNLLGGGGQSAAAQSGFGMVDMIFGKNQDNMINALAKSLGLDSSIIKKLLGFVTPLVMGVLGKQVKSQGLDIAGLGSLLGDQKNILSKVLPSGLTSSLGITDVLGSTSDAVKGMQSSAQRAGRHAMGAAEDAASAGGSMLKYFIPLLLLGVLAWFGYAYLFKPAADRVNGGGVVLPNVDDLDFSKIDFGNFDFQGMQDKLGGITDGFKNVTSENASNLADKIKDFTGGIESMGLDNLSGVANTAVNGVITTFVKSIKDSLDKMTDDGILSILKPVVNALIEKFTSMGFK